MLPLRDINPTLRTPVVTYALIAANVAAFVYQYLVLPPSEMAAFVGHHAVVPLHLLGDYVPSLSTPFTSMFMHGGLAHLASNLWFLQIFGDNVEDVLGRARFLFFYLTCGLIAVFAHALTDPTSTVPMVGASGAISGVLGAYVLLYPRARVVTFFPLFFLFEVPAGLFILVWFGMQVLSGFGSLGAPAAMGGGIAFFAHIGGFVAGVGWVLLTGARKQRRPVVTLGPSSRYRRRLR